MSGLPWFRMYVEFATDPDIQCLAFEDQRHYVIVLCMKGGGILDKDYPTAEKREQVIRRTLGLDTNAAEEAKRRLVEALLIDGEWQPLAWEKRQHESDVSTSRVQRWRAKQKGNVSETPPDTDTDTDTDSEKKEDARERADRFDEFWSAYPRRVGKAAAKRVWSRKGLNAKADEILEHLRARVRSDAQWLAEGGKFIPHPSTWLNRDGWEDEYQTEDANGADKPNRKPSAVERAQRATGGEF